MIKTGVKKLRDPFILLDNDVYYMYGSDVCGDDWEDGVTWGCYKNTSGRLDGEWIKTKKNVVQNPPLAVKNRWAPEVHKYKGSYYMFTTYFSSKTNHRGCTVLKSEFPEGPFSEITNGTVTPEDWDAIDGTFYVDEDGNPWMIFVHEWTSTDDGVGRMAAAKLSDDLTHFVSEPIELFRADAPKWANKNKVTDGCFMYKSKDGKLMMIWSNFTEANLEGYCVGIAYSKNGKVDGEWEQDEKLLFSKGMFGENDGGHGMIFKGIDGDMYLSIHSPNHGEEEAVILPIIEKDGRLTVEI